MQTYRIDPIIALWLYFWPL